jgi:hypothetical protein
MKRGLFAAHSGWCRIGSTLALFIVGLLAISVTRAEAVIDTRTVNPNSGGRTHA